MEPQQPLPSRASGYCLTAGQLGDMVILMTTTNNTQLRDDAIKAIETADFDMAWPEEDRYTLEIAAASEDGIPPYAVRRVEKALRVVNAIEKRLNRDIEVGEASLSHADKQRLLASR